MILSIIALTFGLIGSTILAFSLSALHKAIISTLKTFQSMINNNAATSIPNVMIGNVEDFIIDKKKNSDTCTTWGIVLLILSFLLQIIALVINNS